MSSKKTEAYDERTCLYCGKRFIPKNKRQKCCSPTCSYKYGLAMQKTRTIKKECVICGKEYWGYGKSKTCSEECRKQYISSKMRRLHDSRRNAGPKPMTRKKKRIIQERAEYMRRVKASGMSYGQYRSRRGEPIEVPAEMEGTIVTDDKWMGGGEVQVNPKDLPKVRAHIKPGVKLPKAPEPTKDSRRENDRREDRKYMAIMGIFPQEEGGTPETESEKIG